MLCVYTFEMYERMRDELTYFPYFLPLEVLFALLVSKNKTAYSNFQLANVSSL